MSKGRGQKIAIKFDKALLGDVSGLTHPPAGGYEELPFVPGAGQVFTASHTGYGSVGGAFDGNTSSYWGTASTLPQWIQVDLGEGGEYVATKFRYYSGGSYRIREFTLSGSNDGESWDDLLTEENANSTGWREWGFENTTAYRYYRWTVATRWSTRIYMYEIELWGPFPIGNNRAFTVTGLEKNPLFYGEPALREYHVAAVERYPGTDDTILLTFDEANRFNDVEGDITVAYNQSLGTLAGTRPVESFSVSFTPTDLEPTPIDEHTISVGVTDVAVNLLPVTYSDTHTDHTVSVGVIEVTVALIHVDDINP